jgi:hypothetical protein
MQKIGFWVVTVLFLLPMAGSGIPELLGVYMEGNVATFARLGYPLYLMRILGLAKILGAVAIVSDKSVRLKEWAYAGYTFNLLGALASHLLAGDGPHALMPVTMLPLVLASYRLWRSHLLPPRGGELPLEAV